VSAVETRAGLVAENLLETLTAAAEVVGRLRDADARYLMGAGRGSELALAADFREGAVAIDDLIQRLVETAAGAEDIAVELDERTQSRANAEPTSAARPSVATRAFVLARDGLACVECGSTADLTVDHKQPRARGGGNDPSNLQTLCRSCNSRKGTKVAT
jgi:hypothetical protein